MRVEIFEVFEIIDEPEETDALDDLAIRALKPKPAYMVAERAEPVVILAVYVVGNGTANRDQLRAGRHGQQPAVGNRQPLEIAQ